MYLCVARKAEAQQQMAHLDFAVNNLEEAVQYAIECGATMAENNFRGESYDRPAGHPFVYVR